MSETTPTPGPWHVEQDLHAYLDEPWMICHPGTVDNLSLVCRVESEADARLIAAAPVLLQKLEWILTDMTYAAPETFYARFQTWFGAALIAINEARGEA